MTTPRSIPSPPDDYDPAWYPALFEIEDRHFWFTARNRVLAALMASVAETLEPGHRILEVGCGTGNVLRVLKKAFPQGIIVGMDVFFEGLHYARRRVSCPLVQGDMRMPPFATQFEVVGLFDTLEHLEDDLGALRDIYKLLLGGGVLLLSVPAHPQLWSYFDVASRHRRRYELKELKEKLVNAGFAVEFMTQYMASIYPLMWLQRKVAGLLRRSQSFDFRRSHELACEEFQIIPVINKLLALLLTQEARVIAHRCSLPIGTSILALARKLPV